jgi:hypothetical protein
LSYRAVDALKGPEAGSYRRLLGTKVNHKCRISIDRERAYYGFASIAEVVHNGEIKIYQTVQILQIAAAMRTPVQFIPQER